MSEEKTPKKEVKKVTSTEKKNKSGAPQSAEKDTKGADRQSKEASSEKSTAINKSASQTSISHFSSVATNEYRSGWEAIFGSGKVRKKKNTKSPDKASFPMRIEIQDQDITEELRALLYMALKSQAQREGISLAKYRKMGVIKYEIECNITKK